MPSRVTGAVTVVVVVMLGISPAVSSPAARERRIHFRRTGRRERCPFVGRPADGKGKILRGD